MSLRICAVVRGASAGALDALEHQTTRPDGVRVVAGSWNEAVRAGQAEGAEWLWLLDGAVRPEPEALERMLAALGNLGDLEAPALVCSRVLARDGRLHPAHEPWISLLDRTVVIEAARRHLTSLRLARWGSLLVSRAAIEEHGPPRADFAGGADDLEWTSRLLKEGEGHGYLVPESVALSTRPPHRPFSGSEARNRARMVRGGAWIAQESVWFAFMLALDAAGALARRMSGGGG